MQIIGRSSSHFTRVTLIFAHELGVPVELVPVYDLTALDPVAFAGNPALRVPTLRRGDELLFGAENICRVIAEGTDRRIVWPEQLRANVSRNAQELVWHGMNAQVQIAFGTVIGKLPADNIFFAKSRAGFEGALRWLDDHLADALDALPARDLSLFEVTLFCLLEHIGFRPTLPLDPYPALTAFAGAFATRPSAQRTVYRFDVPPPSAAV